MTTDQEPAMVPASGLQYTLSGEVGDRVVSVIEQWILPLVESNPAILEMFRERDLEPLKSLSPWEGEYAGKYLTHSVQIYRLTRSGKLKEHIEWFVGELIRLQAEDGYLGPWSRDSRLTGEAPNSGKYQENRPTWDAWGHYHIMLGLLFWYRETSDAGVLGCLRKIADLFCRKFLTGAQHLYATSPGCEEMNMSVMHAFCLLYELTAEPKYLEMARQIEKELEMPPCGDYIRAALEGKAFYQMRKPRWESLHLIQGIGELYYITGDEKYRQAFENIWWSIAKNDRHNNGGFSSNQMATGDPYENSPIETCCTIAWMALCVDMLKMTGNPVVADELELSLMNAGLGSLSRSGRWSTYNTPMEGDRRAFYIDHNWQARPGSPELSCCAVNAPRCLGMISDWGVMEHDEGIAVNYYGPATIRTRTRAGNEILLRQQTDYPISGHIEIGIELEAPQTCDLKLRIPQWSGKTRLEVNGKPVSGCVPGEYVNIKREWNSGDVIVLDLDMSLHYWVGEGDYEGKSSIYRGPVLLCYDPRFDVVRTDHLPVLDARSIEESIPSYEGWLKPWILFEYRTGAQRSINLCDFASAGRSGTRYLSWFEVKNVDKVEFSTKNTLRSFFT